MWFTWVLSLHAPLYKSGRFHTLLPSVPFSSLSDTFGVKRVGFVRSEVGQRLEVAKELEHILVSPSAEETEADIKMEGLHPGLVSCGLLCGRGVVFAVFAWKLDRATGA